MRLLSLDNSFTSLLQYLFISVPQTQQRIQDSVSFEIVHPLSKCIKLSLNVLNEGLELSRIESLFSHFCGSVLFFALLDLLRELLQELDLRHWLLYRLAQAEHLIQTPCLVNGHKLLAFISVTVT
jgi:hypothetical protein